MTDAVLRFMGSDRGRLARVAAGSGLLTWGLAARHTVPGKVAAALSLAPLLSGLTNRCILPPPSA